MVLSSTKKRGGDNSTTQHDSATQDSKPVTCKRGKKDIDVQYSSECFWCSGRVDNISGISRCRDCGKIVGNCI